MVGGRRIERQVRKNVTVCVAVPGVRRNPSLKGPEEFALSSNRYLSGILTVIALLLAFNLLLARDSSRSNGAVHLVRTAFAQSAQKQVSDEVVFSVGNQDVRK